MKTKHLIFILTIALMAVPFISTAQTASQIIDKVDQITSAPQDIYQKLQITLIDKSGRQQVRKAEMWQKGPDKRLFRFTEPASYRGIGILSLPGDVMYLYMPAYGRERRIASSVKNQKFAGTDLTYDDLQARNYKDKFNAKLLKTDANYYWLELKPKDTKSAYSKLILKVKKSDYTPVYLEFYDRGGNKVKTLATQFEKVGKYWNAKKVTVKDLKRNHTTVMEALETKFDQGLSDDIFTVRYLKQL